MMPESFTELLSLGLTLLKSNNFRAVAALLIFAGVKFGGPFLAKWKPFFGEAKGKVVLVIALAVANGLFQSFLPGSVPTMGLIGDCILAALSAAGGFSLAKPFMPEPKSVIEAVK